MQIWLATLLRSKPMKSILVLLSCAVCAAGVGVVCHWRVATSRLILSLIIDSFLSLLFGWEVLFDASNKRKFK